MKSLDFHEIQKDLEAYLGVHPEFKDYNYAASGTAALVGVLAYNAHYLGYYSKMMTDESFVDSAHTMEALLSHAKRLGYLAKGKKAAVATIRVEVQVPVSSGVAASALTAPAGSTFKATNSSQDSRNFVALQSTDIPLVETTATHRIFRGDIHGHEGVMKAAVFQIHPAVINEAHVIRDVNCDISTLAVMIAETRAATTGRTYRRATGPQDINSTDAVYTTWRGADGFYYIVFPPSPNAPAIPSTAFVKTTYLATAGAGGNGAVAMQATVQTPTSGLDINNFDVAVTLVETSQGGCDAETEDDLKAAIPAAFRRQNRAVTAEDIKGVVSTEFRDAAVVTCWGGEDNMPRRYDKKFICVVPKSSKVLGLAARREIKAILDRYHVAGECIEFVDAVEQQIEIDVAVRKKKTSALTDIDVVNAVTAATDAYLLDAGKNVLDFSAYALAAAVRGAVPDVEVVAPSLQFYDDILLGAGVKTAVKNYGVECFHPAEIYEETGSGVVETGGGEEVVLKRGDTSKAIRVVVRARPVVTEVKATRNSYLGVKTRTVRVVK